MRILPRTLNDGWSPAELSALHLDGLVLPLGAGYHAVDQPLTPAARADSLSGWLPEALILELDSAAWVLGAAAEPRRHTVAVDSRARIRTTGLSGVQVREIVVDAEQLLMLAGRRVTSPAHTIIEFARRSETTPAKTVHRLVELHRVDPALLHQTVRRRRTLPHKHRALSRLEHWFPTA